MSSRHRLLEIAQVFLKLGTISMGGPAAHIALMEDEFVVRRRWISRDRFLDLLGATNLIPGPNSTEMAISLGFIRGGWGGWFVAGAAFVLPAVSITAICAWLYVRTGTLPQATRWWLGISPAAIAVIALAVWRLMRTAVKSYRQAMIGAAVAAAAFAGVSEIAALFLGGAIGMLWLRRAIPRITTGLTMVTWLLLSGVAVVAAAVTTADAPVRLWDLGTVFLKVGSVLYGGGYVLVAFLEGALVRDRGWLTERQLLDAIAVGQFTPGPVLSTATFIGYVLAGLPGAIVATVGIFLPSFCFVAGLQAVLPWVRKGVWTAAFLDAVNVAAIGLMIAVTIRLSLGFTDWRQWLIAVAALAAGAFFKLHSAWLIVGGAIAGAWLL
jgi:chromate transporter